MDGTIINQRAKSYKNSDQVDIRSRYVRRHTGLSPTAMRSANSSAASLFQSFSKMARKRAVIADMCIRSSTYLYKRRFTRVTHHSKNSCLPGNGVQYGVTDGIHEAVEIVLKYVIYIRWVQKFQYPMLGIPFRSVLGMTTIPLSKGV